MSAAQWLVEQRRAVVLLWGAAVLALAPLAAGLSARLDAGTRLRGSESEQVDVLLSERFATPYAQSALLVARGLPPLETAAGRGALEQIVSAVARVPGVRATYSHLDGADPLFTTRDAGDTFIVVGMVAGESASDDIVQALRQRTRELSAALGDAVTLRWTGAAPLALDLRAASAADARRSELRALPLTLLLLVLAFGSIAAALLPLLGGVCAVIVALGISALAAYVWELSILLENIVSILGLALGIDYALLIVGRFREALAAGAAPAAAAALAASRAGRTVLVSGASVAVGFAALLLVPIDELRSVAAGGLIVVTVAVLFATTLLPGLLALLGTRVNALPVRRQRAPSHSAFWRRWGERVTQRPLLVLVAAGIPIVLLTLPALRLSTVVPRAAWLPPQMESARALDDLHAMERSGMAGTVRVLLELPPGVTAADATAWHAAEQLSAAALRDERVAAVRSLPALAARYGASAALFRALLPDTVRRIFQSSDDAIMLVEITPRDDVTISDLARLVDELRATDAAALGIPNARILVGGLPAYQADYERAVARAFPRVIMLVVGGTFLALLLAFRSVLVPLKAIVLNLLSVGAAYGMLVLVFQDGHGVQLFGMERPLDGVFPAVPILVFCTVFGLSMDYEVFLVSRIAEARRRPGSTERGAIVDGLVHTAGIITSAAAIMVAIFVAFAFGAYVPAKLLGFTLAVAVAVDATLVRMAIGPALLRLAGQWNWWPGDRGRRGGAAAGAAGTADRPSRGTARAAGANDSGSR